MISEIFEVTKHNTAMLGCILAYLVFTRKSLKFSRFFLGFYFIICLLLMSAIRMIWKKIVRRRLLQNDKLSHLLIITEEQLADDCVSRLNTKNYQAYTLSGIVLLDQAEINGKIQNVNIVGNADTMMEYIRLNVVDQVLIHVRELTDELKTQIQSLVNMGIVVHINLKQFDELPNQQINQLGDLSVITTCFQEASSLALLVKRAMDIIGALVGLVITAIAFLFVAPVIYIKSPGPVFFSQERVGRNGRKFRIYKFRSMYLDAEKRKKELMAQNEMQGLMFKMDNDPRIIKGIGHFIRNTSIDELPQFWNILKGDMSLVGTRPPTVDEFEQYTYHHKVRLSFRPGLTGMWQVSGRSDITDFEEVVRLDEKYIANWSIGLDIRILFKTVQVVLRREGSK
jgi:exopolysaccharide biosynthesis polyprenyl glycosylphosphotransferase